MSTETLLTGAIAFIPGVPERRVKEIARELADYTEVEPERTVSYDEISNVVDLPCVILFDGKAGNGRYEINYKYVNYSSHLYDDEWEDLKKAIISHAKEIEGVSISLFYLSEPDMDMSWGHDDLMEALVQQVENKLTEDDE